MERKEIIFGMNYSDGVRRCHAEIVKELPKKTNRWSNGYIEIGTYDIKGKTWNIWHDRDQSGQFSYYAIEAK